MTLKLGYAYDKMPASFKKRLGLNNPGLLQDLSYNAVVDFFEPTLDEQPLVCD